MSILTNTINTTTVTYETPFIYTYQLSLSDIDVPLSIARLTTLIPDGVSYIPAVEEAPITAVTEESVAGGTLLTYVLDFTDYEGAIYTLQQQCQFEYPATTSSYENTLSLFINSSATAAIEASAEVVSLVLSSDFRFSTSQYIPEGAACAGGYVIWKFILQNFGDPGSVISNVSLTTNIPQWVTVNSAWPIYGYDRSDSAFADDSFDGRTADSIAADGSSFSFSLPGDYTGTAYEITVIGEIDAEATPNQYPATLTWEADTVSPTVVGYLLLIGNPSYDMTLTSDIPAFVQPGRYYISELYCTNTGNEALTSCVLSIDFAEELDFSYLSTGTFGIPEVSFLPDISYSVTFVYTASDGTTATEMISGCSTKVDRKILASELTIPDGYRLTQITIPIQNFVTGMASILPTTVVSTVKPDTQIGASIQFHGDLSGLQDGTPISVISNAQTTVDNNVMLMLTKSQEILDSYNDMILNNHTIRYTGTITCSHSYVYEPILIEYLPTGTTYIGNEHYTYYDGMSGTTYESDESGYPLPLLTPSVQTLADGHSIVRFSYTGTNSYDLKQNDILTVSFDVKVTHAIGMDDTITNKMYLGNYGLLGVAGPEMQIYLDTSLDMDGDTFYPETLVQSNEVTATLQTLPSLFVDTLVKGSLNSEFTHSPVPLGTGSNTPATFRLLATNTGDEPLYGITIIDILPYVNDTSILDSSIARGSGIAVSYISHSLSVLPVGTEAIPSFTPFYSSGTDPVRFDASNQTVGTDPWSDLVPESVKSLRLLQDDTPFLPGQTIQLDVEVLVPAEITSSVAAYNSFALQASSLAEDGTSYTALYPVEPYKKGLTALSNMSIYGIVFKDLEKNGIWASTDPGLNNVLVSLYDENGELMRSTTTSTIDSIAGSYSFENLDAGMYYLIFTPYKRSYVFTTQVLDQPFGSRPDANGITPAIVITDDVLGTAVYAGILYKGPETAKEANASAHRMTRNALLSNMLLNLKLNDVLDLDNTP